MHSPKEPAGLIINDPAEGFLSYIPDDIVKYKIILLLNTGQAPYKNILHFPSFNQTSIYYFEKRIKGGFHLNLNEI